MVSFATPATKATLSNIESIMDGSDNDVLIGNSSGNTFYFTESSGKNLVYGSGGDDVLDFSGVTSTVRVTEAHGGS